MLHTGKHLKILKYPRPACMHMGVGGGGGVGGVCVGVCGGGVISNLGHPPPPMKYLLLTCLLYNILPTVVQYSVFIDRPSNFSDFS